MKQANLAIGILGLAVAFMGWKVYTVEKQPEQHFGTQPTRSSSMEDKAKTENIAKKPQSVDTFISDLRSKTRQRLHSVLSTKNSELENYFTRVSLHLHNQRDLFNRSEILKLAMQHLTQDQANIDLAKHLLTKKVDPHHHPGGEEQAIQRIYAIELLKHLAKRGNINPLQSTIVQLQRRLTDPTQRGRVRLTDLEDMVRIYTRL